MKLENDRLIISKKLAKVEDLKAGENIVKPKASASSVVKSSEIYIPLEGLIDLDVERQRLTERDYKT